MPTLTDKSFEEQLTTLFDKISQELNIPIIYGLQVYDKPKWPDDYEVAELRGQTRYPFFSYTMQSLNRVANIQRNEQREDNVYTVWQEQYEMMVSMTAVSHGPFSGVEAATRLHGWLTDSAQNFLNANKIVIVSTTPILPRDFMLVNDYERRIGFDINIRMAREVDKLTPRIEIVNIPPGTIIN